MTSEKKNLHENPAEEIGQAPGLFETIESSLESSLVDQQEMAQLIDGLLQQDPQLANNREQLAELLVTRVLEEQFSGAIVAAEIPRMKNQLATYLCSNPTLCQVFDKVLSQRHTPQTETSAEITAKRDIR